ncbi:MAG: cadherin-like domain-containing protein, partial [Methylobacteriaceae bacterium]|nr:cadherin-like domain-containing protein [Methylobacteriaceae bacterium]
NSATGILALTGTDTLAHYKLALDEVQYHSTSGSPSGGRDITFNLSNGVATDPALLNAPHGLALDLAPTLTGITGTATEAVQGGSAVTLLTATPTVGDVDNTATAGATVQVTNAQAGDNLFISGVQSGTLDSGKVAVSWNSTTHTLSLTGVDSFAEYQSLLTQVTYQDGGTDTTTVGHPTRTIAWSVSDGLVSSTVADTTLTIDRPPALTNETLVVSTGLGGTTTSTATQSVLASGQAIDRDGDTLTLTAVNGSAANIGQPVNGSHGTLTLSSNGGFTYLLNDANGPTDSFTYTISDGHGGSSTGTLTFDLPPEVTSAAVTAINGNTGTTTGDLTVGAAVTITVTFNAVVDVTGTPLLALNDGASASYTSGSGTNALTFTYNVGASQNAATLASTGLSGGTIDSAAGAPAITTNAAATFTGVQIDTTPPTVSSIVLSSSQLNIADEASGVTATVTFSEKVTGFDAKDLVLPSGVHASTPTSSDGGITWTTTLTADANVAAESAIVSVGIADPWADLAGNPGAASQGNTPVTLHVDTQAPTVASIVLSSNQLNIANAGTGVTATVTFSQQVTGFDAKDLVLPSGVHAGTPTTSDGGLTWTTTLTADANLPAQSTTISVATTDPWADLAGNPGSPGGSANLKVGRNRPLFHQWC